MQASAELRNANRAGTWPAAGADAVTAAVAGSQTTDGSNCPPLTMNAASDMPTAAHAFAACCRALNHKANTALVEQLPLLQSGTVVDLTRNYVGAAGLQAIAVVLPFNRNVTEVRAPRNGLTNDAVVIFCRAMREHARLAVLDFSDNTDISLAGGLALLSLAQVMPSLREVRLDGTHVPSAVLGKLSRALEMNAARAPTAASKKASPAFASSSARKPISSRPTTASNQSAATQQKEGEAALLFALEERVRAAVGDGYQLPPAVPSTGWRVLEVPILAPPFLFDTEIQLLCTNVFPRLNREFAPYRLVFYPVVVLGANSDGVKSDGTDTALRTGRGGQPALRTVGSYNRELHFLPVCDVTTAVARGRFAAIELVGDRPGDYAQISAAAMLELQQDGPAAHRNCSRFQPPGDDDERRGDGAAATAVDRQDPLQPVLYAAHETALRRTQWLLVATRRETRFMQVPAAFAPLLTADPLVAHPDRHRTVVRDIVYDDALAATAARGARKDPANAPASELSDMARTLEWDYGAEEYQWKRHLAWRRHVVASAPVKELVLSQYSATFDGTDASGAVRLKDLESFEAGVYDRLRVLVRASLSSCASLVEGDDAATAAEDDVHSIFHQLSLRRLWNSTFAQAVAELSSGAFKKNVMNRVVLYAANPPSRNSLLLHGHDATGLAMFMCRAASRLQSFQYVYTLAFYTARSSVLLEEPTDVRSFVVQLVSQLTTDAAVLRYVHAEVDTARLCTFFLQLLSGTVRNSNTVRNSSTTTNAVGRATANAVFSAAGLPDYVAQFVLGAKSPRTEGDEASTDGKTTEDGETAATAASAAPHAFVIVADGIDKLVPPVRPCGALVYDPDGSSGLGNRAEPADWSDDNNARANTRASESLRTMSRRNSTDVPSPLDALFPRALARNVRFIAGCETDSAAFDALRQLGRDSAETLSLGPASANEVEQYLSPVILSRLGLKFSEDDFECARAKEDATSGEYVRYLQDAARGAQEAPGFLTQAQVIQTFPETTAGAAQGVYDRLVCVFGLPLTRSVLGFLTASRWGLTVPELRALLPRLSACRLQELLRLLRPVLEAETPPEASVVMGSASGNAQLGAVRLHVPSFLDVVHREALQAVTDVQQMDNDQRVWHTQLAQYYLSIVYRSLGTRKADRSGARRSVSGVDAAATAGDPNDRPELLAEQRRAMKEVIYHITQSGAFWPQLDVIVLSLPFLQQVYELGLGYAYLRDLTAAFNERYQRHLLGEDIGEASWQRTQPQTDAAKSSRPASGTVANPDASRYALPAVLTRMRDYVRFAHDNGLLLSLRPSLVTQIALQIPASTLNSVHRDAVTFSFRQLLQPQQQTQGGSKDTQQAQAEVDLHRSIYFTLSTSAAASSKSAATHLGPVTCAAYLPNRKFIVTASRDRSLAWVNPQSGTVVWHARQPTAPLESLTMCRTSAYVAAVSGDRTVWIYDGLQGKLVTHCRGCEWFDAPIASVVFSARGRFLWVVTTDTRARCFECETGYLRCTLGVSELLLEGSGKQNAGPAEVRTDGTEGDVDDVDAEATSEPHDGAVAPGTADWHQRQNFLSVLPDPDEDEVCTTVVAHEVRQWQLQPWKSAVQSDGAASLEAEDKAKEKLVAFDMTARCRLLFADDTAVEVKPSWTRPEGYKVAVSWDLPATCQRSEWRRAVHAFALPVAHKAEVHLLALPLEAVNDQTMAAAVRCVCASPLSDDEEVAVMCASPDGTWLAVGMRSGRICLFDISSAYRTWTKEFLSTGGASDSQVPGLTTPVVCEPTCQYTGLMPAPGVLSAPIRTLAFHRDGRLLFALGRSLKCWRVPLGASSQGESSTKEVGEYVWAQTLTCLTVLPPPAVPSRDAELPSNVADVCVGDETGQLTLLKLWKPNY
ncbi:hypothetical protein ABB37_00452 [Leptomonas pyrrhocoris]|uniref:Uncharacterized protein n=1 Tax=Leptomonas pyrrhocoris TaxID=157538 RepID=A0A0M9GAG6_LEPPY|nr:hypothetical protein ABB37_00452 [Leptomonas pyrrhocoris]KPA86213.1 hypothetical protein ABB37_00452 [Leptomonas pyrrhocoris]|eukprot:XP_015664652.1 hypothetical protein ABB37_00452 [Leptomonas pyrrhocoris]